MKMVRCMLSCALLLSSASLFSYVSPDRIDNLITIHEEWCPASGESWAEEASEVLNISDEQERLHCLNALAAICKIDQARKSGNWDSFFTHIGGSRKKIGHAIDLSIKDLGFWGDLDASELFYGYIMNNGVVTGASTQWSVFAIKIKQIQFNRAEQARLEEEARLAEEIRLEGERLAEEVRLEEENRLTEEAHLEEEALLDEDVLLEEEVSEEVAVSAEEE